MIAEKKYKKVCVKYLMAASILKQWLEFTLLCGGCIIFNR